MAINGIYLDYNATTPCDPRVVEKMVPFFSEIFGNPSNGFHRQGRLSAKAVDEAREQVAQLIGVSSKEIIFTAGATESNNIAILGLARSHMSKDRKRIVTSAVEHKSVLGPCHKLSEDGFDVHVLPVDQYGKILLDAAREIITSETLLVSVQMANNEIGTLQPIRELSEIAHEVGAVLHCDSAQMVGKLAVNMASLGVDMASISAHKLYGPKGVGALYVSSMIRSVGLEPVVYGGGQENGIRSGTTNVPAIVGFGEACNISEELMDGEQERISTIRDELETSLRTNIPNVKINGNLKNRLPNTSSITFPKIDADALIFNLERIMIGTGSACSSGAVEPSHVLSAIGLSREEAYSTVRISFGRFNKDADADIASKDILRSVNKLK